MTTMRLFCMEGISLPGNDGTPTGRLWGCRPLLYWMVPGLVNDPGQPGKKKRPALGRTFFLLQRGLREPGGPGGGLPSRLRKLAALPSPGQPVLGEVGVHGLRVPGAGEQAVVDRGAGGAPPDEGHGLVKLGGVPGGGSGMMACFFPSVYDSVINWVYNHRDQGGRHL